MDPRRRCDGRELGEQQQDVPGHARGANTVHVAKLLAKWAGLPEMAVSYAGMKDRHAVTTQRFSVHLPWCVRKCPYCDFNSHQAKGELPFDAYIDALLRDLDQDLPLVWG
ncbi:tRNA pseudouridine(13) synthase TruD, partial [Stenotrophomonas sp. 3diitr2024]|uniref:tRNA pseudouridine(13) synthase TruD n=1 Tax=Stenotrophomonas sp. 3diitr2024 TaxID=3345115 RepID=UPI0035CB3D2C